MSVRKLTQSTASSKTSSAGTGTSAPVITSIIICDSSYNNLDDTALNPSGSYVKLIGTGFKTGCVAYFNGSSLTTTFVSPREVRIETPATTVGAYNIMLFNANNAGGAIYLNLSVSNVPSFTTNSGTLGSYYEANTISNTIVASGDTPLSYSLYSGSLPAGATLNSDGTITGTSPADAGSTTYEFVVNVKDAQGQDATRTFSLTINTDPVTWSSPSGGQVISAYEYSAISNVTLVATSAAGKTITYSANTLPGGITLSGNTISGTNNTVGNTYTRLTATAATTGRTSTNDVVFNVKSDIVTWSSPADEAAYSLTGGTAMANITMSAASAAGRTITYTANALPTGVSLSGDTLYGTPTNAETVYTLLTATANTTNRSATRTISWTITLGDTYWKYTTLVLNAVTPTPTFINDASNNNLQLTIAGDTKPNNFNPYENGYYSNYMNGQLYSAMSAAGSNFYLTGDFTMEAWIYPTSLPGGDWGILDTRVNGATPTQWVFALEGSSKKLYFYDGSARLGATALTTGKWYHLVWVRNGSVLRGFVNGVLEYYNGSYGTSALGQTSTSPYIGTKDYSISNFGTYGYISNLRVVNGTAVYTTGATTIGQTVFTPPTTPLTEVSNTVLLTCNSPQFKDSSNKNFTITPSSSTIAVSPANPFSTPTTAAYNTQYSTYFDGTGDYLSMSDNAAFQMGTGDFTVECWVCPSSLSASDARLWSYQGAGSSTVFNLYLLSTGSSSVFAAEIRSSAGASDVQTNGTTSAKVGTWYHVAFVRYSGTTKLFVNGVQEGSTQTTQTQSLGSGTPAIGYYPAGSSNYFTGHISNFRILKGTAVYTTTFTPSTTPLTAISGTSLLTCQDATLIDNSTNAFTITSAGQAKPIAVSPFTMTTSNTTVTSLGSAYFDGTGDYLSVPYSAAWSLSGDFTIECWLYWTAHGSYGGIVGSADTNTAQGITSGWFLDFNSTSNNIQFEGQGGVSVVTTNTIPQNQWVHIAVVRSGSTITHYLNGTPNGTGSSSTTFNSTNQSLKIGVDRGTTSYTTGYISNLRIVKGTTLYTSNFLPPQAPLTPVANTQLLTCQTNGGANNSQVLDSSSFNHVVTRYGNVQQGTFSPYSQSGWCTYFNGSAGLTSSITTVNMSAGNWTLEAWVYPLSFTDGGNKTILQISGSGSNPGGISFYITSSGAVTTDNGSTAASSFGSVSLNTWSHIAAVRSSGTITYYINGTSIGSNTQTPGSSAGTLSVGRTQSGSNYWNGYISNARIVNGTAIVPPSGGPTAPVGPVANTLVLTCQSNRFVDNSPNNYTLAPTNTPMIHAMSPFAGSTSVPNSYSAYMDGTGYVFVPGSGSANLSPVFGLGTGDYTVELWTWLNNDTSIGIWDFRYQGGGTGLARPNLIYSGGNAILFSIGGTAKITYNVTLPQYTWIHFAIVRISGVTTLYVDGVARGTYNGSEDFGATNTLTVGTVGDSPGYATTELTGYVSNLRVVRGVGIYTGAFTTPTSPLQITQSAGTNIAAIDGIPETGYSTYFDGTGDYLLTATNSAFTLSSDFTVEAWVYLNSGGASSGIISSYPSTGGNGVGLLLNTSNQVAFRIGNDSTGSAFTGVTSSALSLRTWYHVAGVRSGNTMTLYINGQVDGTNSSVAFTPDTTSAVLGRYYTNTDNFYLNGYISNARIVKGTALYTSAFTPSTTPLTAVSGTSLLTCQSNTIKDNSTNNFGVTTNGNATVVKSWSPFGYNTSYLGFQSPDGADISINRIGHTVTGNIYPRIANPFGDNGRTNSISQPYSPSVNGGSYYFDGASDYMTVASSPTYGTMPANGNFTVEGWFYFTDLSIAQQLIFSQRGSSGQYVPYLIWATTTSIVLYSSSNNGSWDIVNNTTLTTGLVANQWYHFAYTRSGSTFRFFVNGVQTYTFTSAAAYTNTNTFNVGMSVGETNTALKGFATDIRYINGECLYSKNFYPGSTPLTPNVTVGANTATAAILLSGTSGGIVDAHGTYNFETVGNVQLVPEDPYNGNYYSNYFDGTGDYLTVPNNTGFDFGTGDFTVEGWFYFWGAFSSTYNGLIMLGEGAMGGGPFTGWGIITGGAGTDIRWYRYDGTETQPTASYTFGLGQWYHIAVTRSGTSLKIFINGAQVLSTTNSTSYNSVNSDPVYIGRRNDGVSGITYAKVYTSNIRIVKGTALYTSAFTPSTAPLTAVSGTSLLTCQSNSFKDNSTNNYTITKNGDVKVKSFNPFRNNSGKSISFDGTGDYVQTLVREPTLKWWGKSYTIEFWTYVNTFTESDGAASAAVGNMVGNAGGNYWSFGPVANGTVKFYYYNGNGISLATTSTIKAGAWHHLAFVNNNGNLTIYIDGISSATGTISGTPQLSATTPLTLGGSNNLYYNGFIKDLRITDGVARTISVPATTLTVK